MIGGIVVLEEKDLPKMTEGQKTRYYYNAVYVGNHPNADSHGYIHFDSEQSMFDFMKTSYYKKFTGKE